MIGRFLFVCGALLLSANGVSADGQYQRTKNGKAIVWNTDPKPGDEASWSGGRDRAAYATGFGELSWYATQTDAATGAPKRVVSSRYFGNMVRGKFEGPVNLHSKRKTDHAIFVDGQRITPWATGPAPSWRVAYPQPKFRANAAAVAETPANGQGAVTKTENAQPTSTSSVGRTVAPRREERLQHAESAGAEKTPNSQNLQEQQAQGRIEKAPVKRPSQQEPGPTKSPVVAEPASHVPAPVIEPEAPAEGPRIIEAQSPARTPKSTTRQTPDSGSFPNQSAQPTIEDMPSASIQPSESAAPLLPTSKESPSKVEDSLRSIRPSPSVVAIPEIAGSPKAKPLLTKEEVIRIANRAARANGYNRADFERAEPQYNATFKIWSVSYDRNDEPEGMDGKHFTIIVDDTTKGTLFELRR